MVAGTDNNDPIRADSTRAQALERYRPALHAFLLRSLRQNPQDIADLTQEVFARFLRDIERGKVIRNPEAYMCGIASHMVYDLIERKAHQRVTFDSPLYEEIVQFEQADDIARRLGMRKDILKALDKLPVAHRTLLLLVEVDGMSCKEAARITGYAVNTVKQYLSIAREEMLTLLQDYWNDEEPGK